MQIIIGQQSLQLLNCNHVVTIVSKLYAWGLNAHNVSQPAPLLLAYLTMQGSLKKSRKSAQSSRK
jgi:hypothetical protein